MTRLERLARACSPYAWNDGFWNGAIDGKVRSSMGQPTAMTNAFKEARRMLEELSDIASSESDGRSFVCLFVKAILLEDSRGQEYPSTASPSKALDALERTKNP